MNKPLLIILNGLVATGKTTTAKAISKSMNISVIHSDVYWFKNKEKIVERASDRKISEVHNEMLLSKCGEYIGRGESVILDCTSRWRSFREKIIERFVQQSDIIFVRCYCPEKIAIGRIDKRSSEGPHGFGSKAEYYRVKNEYDSINDIERKNFSLLSVDTDKSKTCIETIAKPELKEVLDEMCDAIEKNDFSKFVS